MLKELIIIGAGDFGREVSWLVERINAVEPKWNLLGFVDDNLDVQGKVVDGYPVLGTKDFLINYGKEIYIVCSIGTGSIRKKVLDDLCCYEHIKLATLTDPSVVVGRKAVIENGCIICAGTILAISSYIKKNTIINLSCTIGHDTILGECCTVNPGCNISGKVIVGNCVDFGTGSKVIQGKKICENVTIGAGSTVIKDLPPKCTAVGSPAKPIKFFE